MQSNTINSRVVISLLETGSPQQIIASIVPIMVLYTQVIFLLIYSPEDEVMGLMD